MSRGNIYDLKELLGHAQIETTMRSAHLAPEHLLNQASLVSFEHPKNNLFCLNQSEFNHNSTMKNFIEGLPS